MKSCAIIGYQPMEFFFKYNEKHPLCQKIKDALLEQSKALYKRGVRRFYVGGAPGTDMWAGETVLSLKGRPDYPGIEITCAIPFEGYNSQWSDDDIARHMSLLKACDNTQTISPAEDPGAYKKRYYHMIDQSQYVIAVCRGKHDASSDTEQAVKYAKKQDKNIIFIHPETAEITRSDQE